MTKDVYDDVVLATRQSYRRTQVSSCRTQSASHGLETSGALWPRTDTVRLQHHLLRQLPRLSVQPANNLLRQLPSSVPGRRTSADAESDRLFAARVGRRTTMPAYHRDTGRHSETFPQKHWRVEVLIPRHATMLPGWLQSH